MQNYSLFWCALWVPIPPFLQVLISLPVLRVLSKSHFVLQKVTLISIRSEFIFPKVQRSSRFLAFSIATYRCLTADHFLRFPKGRKECSTLTPISFTLDRNPKR